MGIQKLGQHVGLIYRKKAIHGAGAPLSVLAGIFLGRQGDGGQKQLVVTSPTKM